MDSPEVGEIALQRERERILEGHARSLEEPDALPDVASCKIGRKRYTPRNLHEEMKLGTEIGLVRFIAHYNTMKERGRI